MIKKIKKTNGMTIIETLMALSIAGVAIVGLSKGGVEFARYMENKNNGKDFLSILKAVDNRISIDGYNYSFWNMKEANTPDEVKLFINKNFISKTNPVCGRHDGWIPLKDEHKNRSLLDCGFWKKKLPYNANIEIKTKGNNQGFIQDVTMLIDIPEMKGSKDARFKTMDALLSLFKKNDFANKNGSNDFKLIDKTTNKKLSKIMCSVKGQDCILSISWNKQGASQPLKINGTNSMISSQVSFILEKANQDKINTCLEWTEIGGAWSSKQIECGIGLYADTTGSTTPVTINAYSENSSVSKSLLLDKKCNVYSFSGNGLKKVGESPCGIIKTPTTNTIIQYINTAYARKMTISNEFYSETINNKEIVDVALNLYNNLSQSKMNIKNLDVKNEALFTASVKFLDNLTIGTNGLPTIENLNANTLKTFKLQVTENAVFNKNVLLDYSKSSIPINMEVKGSNINTKAPVKANYFISNTNVKVNDVCTDKNAITIQKDTGVVLTCRTDWKTKSKFTWQSNYYGEIGVFNEECPSGWNEIEDIHSRFLIGSGVYKEDWSMPITYKASNKGGFANVLLTKEQMPQHDHNSPQIEPICQACHNMIAPTKVMHGSAVFSNDTSMRSSMAGGNKAHNNLPNYLAIKYCVYAEGDKKSPGINEPPRPPEEWIPYEPLRHNWIDHGRYFDCGAERVMVYSDGLRYTLSDCKLDQRRITEKREREKNTGEIRLTGEKTIEERTIDATQVWKEIDPIYTPDWYDVGSPYDCTDEEAWVENNQYYKKKTCKVNQERFRQNREQEQRFGDIRNVGNPIKEIQFVLRDFKRIVAAAGFDPSMNNIRVTEGNAGTQKNVRIRIKLSKPFSQDVVYRINTQDITTTSILASTENLIYDEFGNPFISVVDNPNGGRLIFDGGFPKYYNAGLKWDEIEDFDDLRTQFKFMHNIVKWIGQTHANRGKILIYGDAIDGHDYAVKNPNNRTNASGIADRYPDFNRSIPKVIEIAGFDYVIKDAKDFGGKKPSKKINIPLKELNKYAAIIVMSSGGWESFNNNTANNFSTYVNNGGGIYIITDHNYFQPTGNQILRKFGSEFYAVVDRNPSNPAYKLTTILNKLSGSIYGDGHVLWKGLDRNGSIHAGGSEGNVRLFTPVEDIVASTQDVVFKAGQTIKDIYVTINGDNIAEDDETFKVVLSQPDTGIIIGENEKVITIVDDDRKVRTLSETCSVGNYNEGLCYSKKVFPKKLIPKLIEKTETKELGKILIKYNKDGERILNVKIGEFQIEKQCDSDIKTLLKQNNSVILKELKDEKIELTLDNVRLNKTEYWKTHYLYDENFKMKRNLCKDFGIGNDISISITGTIKKEHYLSKMICEKGTDINGLCIEEKVSKPIKSCLGDYIRVDDVCVK